MSSHVTTHNLSANETALCGGIAGLAARLVISPLDVIKIRIQVQTQPFSLQNLLPTTERKVSRGSKYSGILHAFRVIAAEEGFKGFFKGNISAEYLYLTYGATQFFTYHHFNTLLDKEYIHGSLRAFASGMLSGSVATAVTYPFDLLRTRFAMQGTTVVYKSLLHAIRDIHKVEGFQGFYRGLIPSVTQIMPYMGLMFLSYEGLCTTAQWLRDTHVLNKDHTSMHSMVCGGIAGVVSKTGVYPLDVVRKRFQVQGPHQQSYVITSIPKYTHTSVFGCIRSIVHNEGILALYKGLLPALLKTGSSSAVTFLVFELSKEAITAFRHS